MVYNGRDWSTENMRRRLHENKELGFSNMSNIKKIDGIIKLVYNMKLIYQI